MRTDKSKVERCIRHSLLPIDDRIGRIRVGERNGPVGGHRPLCIRKRTDVVGTSRTSIIEYTTMSYTHLAPPTMFPRVATKLRTPSSSEEPSPSRDADSSAATTTSTWDSLWDAQKTVYTKTAQTHLFAPLVFALLEGGPPSSVLLVFAMVRLTRRSRLGLL